MSYEDFLRQVNWDCELCGEPLPLSGESLRKDYIQELCASCNRVVRKQRVESEQRCGRELSREPHD